MTYYFDGVLHETPGTFSAVNDDAMVPAGVSTQNMPCILGLSSGGEPNVPLVFSDPEVAKAVLRGGELLQAVLRAMNPSDETGGPAQITAFRVNPAVPSTLVLNDQAASPVINLTSQDWGLWTKGIKVQVGAGSTQGMKASVGTASGVVTQDNIYSAPLSIQYTGSQQSATAAVAGNVLTLSAPTGTVAQAIDLTLYPTAHQLVDYINTMQGFSAVLTPGQDNAPTVNGLDNLAAASVMSELPIPAVLQALVDWFNSGAQKFVSAARATNAGTLPVAIGFTYLAGGSDGVTTTSSWNATLAAMQTTDVQWITPVTSDPTVHAMVDAHVQYMSTTGRMERRAICGTPLGTSDATAVTLAKQINSNRTSLVHLGHYNFDLTGQLSGLQLYAPYVTASALTGAFAAVSPGTPLTNKAMKFAGLERDLLNPTDTDFLLKGGVIPIENTKQGYKVTQSITTWLIDKKFDKREQSVGFACDFVARTVRTNLDVLRGGKNRPLLLGRSFSITDSTLKALATAEPNGPGVIVGDANSPAYLGIQSFIQDDWLAVKFQCSPALPNNYIGITIFAVPYSGSAAA